jgi:hypothetical protein
MIQWHNGIDHASSEFLRSYTGSRVNSLGVIYVDMVYMKGCFSMHSIVLCTYLALYRPDEGRLPAETCCLKGY